MKGVVHAMMGQQTGSREHLKMAQQFFQLVGSSASECDTIPGRQCMASCFFLLRQFDDVLIYCRSIKAYLYGEDDFLWNFGIALASKGEFKVHGSSPLQHQTVFGLSSSSRIAPLHLGALPVGLRRHKRHFNRSNANPSAASKCWLHDKKQQQ